jgi:hypothetical protein
MIVLQELHPRVMLDLEQAHLSKTGFGDGFAFLVG